MKRNVEQHQKLELTNPSTDIRVRPPSQKKKRTYIFRDVGQRLSLEGIFRIRSLIDNERSSVGIQGVCSLWARLLKGAAATVGFKKSKSLPARNHHYTLRSIYRF